MPKEVQAGDAAPWKQRFRAPVTFGSLARANPTRGLAASNRSGIFQLYAWDVQTGELRQLTDRPEGKAFGHISPDGRFVYYLDDEHGNEIGHYVRVPFEGGAPEDITPGLEPYSSWSVQVCRGGNLLSFMLANEEGYQLYAAALGANAALGDMRRLVESKSILLGSELSHSGEVAAIGSSERSDTLQFSLVAVDTATGAQVGELWDGPGTSVEPAFFSPVSGDLRLAATTNRTGVQRPLIWSPRTGERTDLRLDDFDGDVVPQDWSPDGRRLLLCQLKNATQRLYLYDILSHAVTPLQHPSGTFSAAYFAVDDEVWVQLTDSIHPTHLVALDSTTGAQIRTVLPPADVPASRPWRSIGFTSSDGTPIQGWVAVPEGEGPFPTILETHGGPTAVQTESFEPRSQAWLDHGFAFLTINYRGSTTFGRAFQEQIYGDLGHWEVEDMVAARNWLIDEGIARPDEILLTGWSYGGYLTLQALGTRPDLWAGGLAGIAIADWAVQYEDSAGTLKGYEVALFGGTPAEKPEQYAKSSPITYAERVSAPVLIIQGRNDTRTPARPIQNYEAGLKALGKPIEVVWFEAGHGSFVVEQQVEHQEIMLRFASRLLG